MKNSEQRLAASKEFAEQLEKVNQAADELLKLADPLIDLPSLTPEEKLKDIGDREILLFLQRNHPNWLHPDFR